MTAYTYWLPVLPPRALGLFHGSDRNTDEVKDAEGAFREVFREAIRVGEAPAAPLHRARMEVTAHYSKGRSPYHRPETAPLLAVCLRDALLAFVEMGVIRSARLTALPEFEIKFKRCAPEGLAVRISEVSE